MTQAYSAPSVPVPTAPGSNKSSGGHPTAPASDATLDLPEHLITAGPRRGPRGRMEASRGKTHVGRFVVRSVLGRGAFGTVYLAHDPVLDREVALKTPRFTDDDRTSYERFLLEAKAAAKLRHPNIVAVFESGEADGEPFIASEYVDGTVLSDLLKKQVVDLHTTVDWMRQVAEALEYAHSEGIVHRDIKPGNMMISRSGRPQIMDFGLAKRFEDSASLTTEGKIVGTPAYMSPEQARGAQASVGPASDQYSVGVVFYELLCGRTPYLGEAWSVVSQVSNPLELPPAPRALKPGVPRDLEACCLKALEKEPAARYPSLKEFAADLERWLQGQPLMARPISVWERLQRWRRRNKLAAALLTAIATIVTVVGILGYILAFQFRDLAAVASRDAEAATKAKEEESEARRREQRAQLITEGMLIDSYATSGLSVDRNGDACETVLWFANAAALSENHPQRERLNHVRLQSWFSKLALPIRTFRPPGNWCKSLRYHASGRYLLSESLKVAESLNLSGSPEEECEIRDLATDRILPLPLAGPVHCCVWSPDGKQLAIASKSTLTLHAFPAGNELQRWEHAEAISTCGFSADGQRIALGGDSSARVLDLTSGETISPELRHERPVVVVRLNRDGSRLATVTEDRVARVFAISTSLADPEPILPPQTLSSKGKEALVAFLGENRVILPEGNTGISCWDTELREIQWRRKLDHVLSLAVSPDEKLLAVGGFPEVQFLDAQTGEPVGEKIKHRNMVHDLAFSPDGHLIVSGSSDNTARVSRVPSGQPVVAMIPHYDAVHRCAWSPDGHTIATVHWGDNQVRVWKLGGEQAQDFQAAENDGTLSLKLNADATLFFPAEVNSLRRQRSIQVRHAEDGRTTGQLVTSPGLISDATFVPNSTLIALGGSRESVSPPGTSIGSQQPNQEGVVRFVDYLTGESPFDVLVTPSEPVAMAASPDGRVVVALCHAGQVLLLDGRQGTRLGEVRAFDGQSADFNYIVRDRIRFSPSGEQFVIWGTGRYFELRRTRDGELLFAGQHKENFVHDVRFAPDGSRFVSCSSDNTARLWKTSSGEQVAELPHGGWVFSAKFSRDGKRLLTASRDRQARLWDLENVQVVTATMVQSDEIFGVCFSPDEDFFYLSTRDHQISAWDAATGTRAGPIRHGVGAAYELALSAAGSHLLAVGQNLPATGIDIRAWIREPDVPLERSELRMLGEILSSQRIYESGAATALTREEWLDRWRSFRKRRPDYPALRIPPSLQRLASAPAS